MGRITEINGNLQTPTTCHGTLLQFFVRDGALGIYHYQRTADMLLGLPHNLMQYWALLLYLARRSGLKVGWIDWQLGDAHIYDDISHTVPAEYIAYRNLPEDYTGDLVYQPSIDDGVFRAADFRLSKSVPEPGVNARPKLF